MIENSKCCERFTLLLMARVFAKHKPQILPHLRKVIIMGFKLALCNEIKAFVCSGLLEKILHVKYDNG